MTICHWTMFIHNQIITIDLESCNNHDSMHLIDSPNVHDKICEMKSIECIVIDNLIFYPMNKFGLIYSYILKFMNFLIFRDFFRFFLNFSEFNLIYFELNE